MLPRVIYEAYSFGVPVIGTNRGGIPEIIDIGKTGFVIDPEIESDLLDKIDIFKKRPEIIAEMAPYCLKKAEDFLPKKVLKKYIEIYKGIYNKDQYTINAKVR